MSDIASLQATIQAALKATIAHTKVTNAMTEKPTTDPLRRTNNHDQDVKAISSEINEYCNRINTGLKAIRMILRDPAGSQSFDPDISLLIRCNYFLNNQLPLIKRQIQAITENMRNILPNRYGQSIDVENLIDIDAKGIKNLIDYNHSEDHSKLNNDEHKFNQILFEYNAKIKGVMTKIKTISSHIKEEQSECNKNAYALRRIAYETQSMDDDHNIVSWIKYFKTTSNEIERVNAALTGFMRNFQAIQLILHAINPARDTDRQTKISLISNEINKIKEWVNEINQYRQSTIQHIRHTWTIDNIKTKISQALKEIDSAKKSIFAEIDELTSKQNQDQSQFTYKAENIICAKLFEK